MQIIRRSGAQPSVPGPADWFTGAVRIDPLFPAMEPSRVSGGLVTFEPGARSAWHTHPLGQNLIVVSCQCGRKHWHGATAMTAMSHIAIIETLDGRNVEWLEKVIDEDYLVPVTIDLDL